MRRATWILALGYILAIAVPSAWADGFTPTFTCTTCGDIPTAGEVTFPSPNIFEMWGTAEANVQDSISLASNDNPGDLYSWSNSLSPDPQAGLGDYILSITDVTTGDSEFASGMVGIGDPLFITSFVEEGTLSFTPVQTTPAPEPGTFGLIFVGIGSLLAARKRRAQTSRLSTIGSL